MNRNFYITLKTNYLHMKISYFKTALFALMTVAFVACQKENTLNNLNVAAVKTLYEPVNNKSIVLQASATASVYFEWEPALSEDGTLTLYQIAFDTLGGKFTNPAYVLSADNNGANTHATLTHKQVNKIAALVGIKPAETGKLSWTVISSKGINPKLAAVSNTLEVTRLAGFADIPNTVYLTGEGSEGGNDLSKANIMKSMPQGVYEIYTQLTAGKKYHFTDAKVGTPREFFINDNGVLVEKTDLDNITSTVTTTGVYFISLDFSTGSTTMTQITKCEFFFCPTNSFPFELDYVANGVWTAKSKPINFKVESWGKDERYKFKMTTGDGDKWWGAPKDLDSPPTGLDTYYNLIQVDNNQWNNKFKFAGEMDNALVDMSVIMSASGPYTHSVKKVGDQ